MSITIRSDAFVESAEIPQKYTGEGDDCSPPLAWDNVPEATQQFALICDDPDAPRPQPWVHWVIYAIPADVRSLPEGVPKTARLTAPAGVLQGKNSWGEGDTIVHLNRTYGRRFLQQHNHLENHPRVPAVLAAELAGGEVIGPANR